MKRELLKQMCLFILQLLDEDLWLNIGSVLNIVIDY